MQRLFSLILLFCFAQLTQAQFKLLPGETFDFGTVEEWRNQPAEFILVNTGSRPLAVLKVTGSDRLLADYPKTFIAPGESATLTFRLYTPHAGPFSEQAELFLSAADKPVRLTIKGKINSLAPDALTACPGQDLQGAAPLFVQRFIALDKSTGQAVPGARFNLMSFSGYEDNFKIPANGKAVVKNYKSGEYRVSVRADGYLPVDSGLLILAGERYFTYYLEKPQLTVTEPDPQPEPIPEPQPEITITVPDPEPVRPNPVDTGGSTLMPLDKFKPNNLVFVLDVSSSMRILGRIDMLKAAMLKLTAELREADRISIITFTTAPVLRVKGVNGSEKDSLNGVIRSLQASGATNGIKGLRFAYELAERNFIPEGNNTVIIATDGEFAQTDENGNDIQALVKEYLAKNIKLGVMAFGRDAEALKSMERMAARGAGGYMRMDNAETSPSLLLKEIMNQSQKP